MTNFLIFALCVYGFSNAVVFSDGPFFIFKKFRDFVGKFPSNLPHGVECMICFPFQFSLLLSVINILLFPQIHFTPIYSLFDDASLWWMIIPLDGAVGSGSAWIIHTIQECLESITNKNNADDGQ